MTKSTSVPRFANKPAVAVQLVTPLSTPNILLKGHAYAVRRLIGVQSNALCPELSTLSTDTLWPTIASRMGLSERLSRRRHEGSI